MYVFCENENKTVVQLIITPLRQGPKQPIVKDL